MFVLPLTFCWKDTQQADLSAAVSRADEWVRASATTFSCSVGPTVASSWTRLFGMLARGIPRRIVCWQMSQVKNSAAF